MTTLIIKAALAIGGHVPGEFVDRQKLGLELDEHNQVAVITDNMMPGCPNHPQVSKMYFGLTIDELRGLLTKSGEVHIKIENVNFVAGEDGKMNPVPTGEFEEYNLVYEEKVREADLKEYEPYFKDKAEGVDIPEIKENVEVQNGEVIQ